MTSSIAWCLGGLAAIVVTAVTGNPMAAMIVTLAPGAWSVGSHIADWRNDL
jgi:hypothetical protein